MTSVGAEKSDGGGELADLPEFLRDKLLEMRSNIDDLESVYSGIADANALKDLQSQVSPFN